MKIPKRTLSEMQQMTADANRYMAQDGANGANQQGEIT